MDVRKKGSVLCWLLWFWMNETSAQSDPCSSHSILNEEERSAGYAYDALSGDIAISDDRLESNWYRIESNGGEDMPTSPPGTFKCNTWYPIWLNGDLPSDANTQTSQPVCIQTFSDDCQYTWNIDIKRCPGNFLVYKLVRSSISKSAYCFGTEIKCPDGEYSETGYSPGCSNEFPAETFLPVVTAELAEGRTLNPAFGPSLVPVFRCSFGDIPGQTYSYDVYWYIDDSSVVAKKQNLFIDIDQALLLPTDWVDKHQMNMVVKCAVRARFNSTSVPGPYYFSDNFEAGVKPANGVFVYEIVEGEEISIPMVTSVPLGCIGSNNLIMHQCSHTLKIAQPKYQSSPSDTCVNTIEQESLAFETQNCGVTFTTNSWNTSVNLNVTGYVDNVYNSDDRIGHIRLRSQNSATDLSGVWNTVNIPDLQVIVSDQDSVVSSRMCSTTTDPNYWTADGRYFNHRQPGEYVLYKHKRYPYSVHTLTNNCDWRGTCNCGVAIRSHDSLFVVRTCDVISNQFYASGRHYPSISYSVCDNKNMVIEKIQNGYQVTLPIGTIITLQLDDIWISPINIKPSSLDVELSEGLCGFISQTRDQSDDFMPRGSTTPVESSSKFVSSWRVAEDSDESLFSELPNFPSEDLYLKEYCVCADQADHKDPIAEFNEVHCNLTQPMVQCKNVRTPLANNLYQECHRSRRRRDIKDTAANQRQAIVKRNTEDSDDVIEYTPLTYDDDFDPDIIHPEPEWRNGWTEEFARQACIDRFAEMAALEICQKYANLDVSLYTESCINDIKMTGSKDFIVYTVRLMEDVCRLEISKNESLFTSKDGEESVLEMIENKLCPDDCNNNGFCNRTECVCNAGYIGPECSKTLVDGPRRLTIPENGLCGTKSRSCQRTNIFGTFYTEKVYCRFQHFTATENGKQLSGSEYVIEAVYKYENLISCEFPSSRKKRSTGTISEGYDISLSYDQTNYGDTVSVIIYDEDCFSCNSTTVTCVELDSCMETTDLSTSANDQMTTASSEIDDMTTIFSTGKEMTKTISIGNDDKTTTITSENVDLTTTVFPGNEMTTVTSENDEKTTKVSDGKNGLKPDSSPGLSLTTLVAICVSLAVLLIILATLTIYKFKADKDRKRRSGRIISVNVWSVAEQEVCIPPCTTNLPAFPNRQPSDISIGFQDSSRATTPVDLFMAKHI